ncbi:uncharacterized protein [Epargyreus clarus]|uniref:uncharacterized protein n=1 Tax=Epargyreus clarus TaxID=520877 RepID=UPI003C2D0F86
MATPETTQTHTSENDQSDIIYNANVKVESTKHVLENNIIVQIKPENLNSDDLISEDSIDNNPFENVQLEIKREIPDDSNDKEARGDVDDRFDKHDLSKESEIREETNADSAFLQVKSENVDDSLVSYDYPNFDDGGSMDSRDAAALGNVEACLQDDVNVKDENYGTLEQPEKLDIGKVRVKDELELTVTETHLISNKVINTTSTITNPQDGLIQSETTKTVVMEIHPMMHAGISLPKIGNPEEILPTTYNDTTSYDDTADYDDVFQLNSITGNELSLEQEAYGLLKEKDQRDIEDKHLICPKCPKVCKTIHQLKRHIGVHNSIDKRALGVIKGKQTRIENRKKKLQELDDDFTIGTDIDIQDSKSSEISGRKIRIDNRNKRRKAQEGGINHKGVKKRKKKYKDDPDEKFSIRIKSYKKEIDIKEDKAEYDVKVIKQENIKKEGYQCTCGNVFQRKSRLETCLRSHNLLQDTNSCYSCHSCNKQFTDKNDLALHRRRLHRKRFPCKFCPTDYNTRKELYKHLQIHQKVQLMEYKVISEVVKGKQKLRCFMCAKTCSELSELKCHVMDDHKEPYTCPHCQETFPKIIDFGNHTKTFHPEVEGQSVLDVLEAFSKLVKAWKCEECELQFHEADKLALHQIEKHSPDVKTECQFQCDDCRRVFVSQKGLTSHRRIHHNTDSVDESETVEKGVMCVECRKICKDDTALTSHMRFHSPERKYPCKFCDFRFATPEKRKAHAEIHTGDMKFVCFICEYQCSSENRLNQHKMSLKHLNMREFLRTGVPLIEEQSTSKKDKSKEKDSKKKRSDKKKEDANESIVSPNSDEYACDICGDKFSSESKMLEHKQTHPFIEFPNEDKPTRIFFK